MNLRNLPVAVFDSGVGGISVLRELTHRMPREKFLYFGDCANAPYGTKTTERVRELTCRAVEDLLTQGVKGGLLLDEKGLRAYSSYRVEVKDSNGCGDTFHGAFVAAKIKGLNNDDACKYASAAAAIKCTRLGARYGMANDAECRAFLQERGAAL